MHNCIQCVCQSYFCLEFMRLEKLLSINLDFLPDFNVSWVISNKYMMNEISWHPCVGLWNRKCRNQIGLGTRINCYLLYIQNILFLAHQNHVNYSFFSLQAPISLLTDMYTHVNSSLFILFWRLFKRFVNRQVLRNKSLFVFFPNFVLRNV